MPAQFLIESGSLVNANVAVFVSVITQTGRDYVVSSTSVVEPLSTFAFVA